MATTSNLGLSPLLGPNTCNFLAGLAPPLSVHPSTVGLLCTNSLTPKACGGREGWEQGGQGSR